MTAAVSENAPMEESISDLWRFYDEHAAQARQHETLRAAVTTILAGFAATMVGIVTRDGFERADILPGALIIVIGLIGAALSLKHYERNRFHTTVLRFTRKEITRLRTVSAGTASAASTGKLRCRACACHESTFSFLDTLKAKPGERREGECREGECREGGESSRQAPKSWLLRFRLFRSFVLWLALPVVIVISGIVIVVLASTS
jgi:hypothetical protein